MFIKNCITDIKSLVTIEDNATIAQTIEVLKQNRLKSIPVIDKNRRFVGILSKESLFELFEKGFSGDFNKLKNQTIEEAVVPMKALSLTSRFEETLPIIVRHPFVPIVDEHQTFLGIVKRNEITKALEESFGVGVTGTRLLVGTVEAEGRLEKILEIAHSYYLHIITAVTFDAKDQLNRRILLKFKPSELKEEFINRLEKSGFKILTVHEL